MFAIVFFWTPPHFWALALLLKDDYARAGVPMLPVVAGVAETKRNIVLYTLPAPGIDTLVLRHPGGRVVLPWRCTGARTGVRILCDASIKAACHRRGRQYLRLFARLPGATFHRHSDRRFDQLIWPST